MNMKRCHKWLLAVLSVLTLMTITTAAVAEDKTFSGQVEIGVSGMDTKDNPVRVNEYANGRSDDGLSFAPKVSLEGKFGENSELDLDADINGPRDQQYNLDLDLNRIFRLGVDYQVLEHWKDHETLDQMGATGRYDTGGGQPSVMTDKLFAELEEAGLSTTVGGGAINYDAAEAYQQELNNNYIVTRRELKSETDLTLPNLPNVTFHAGMRIETREGLEQAIGVTKCDTCHVSANGKKIDESTEDYSFGATGKFGPATIDYEYMKRTFSEDGATPVRYYEDAGNPTAFNLLYENGDYPYARTPDSEKDSHKLKARVDLPQNTSISASYVKSEVESSKSATQGEYQLQDNTLNSEYESFGGKIATKIGDFRLSMHGSRYTIDVDGNTIYYPAREGVGAWPGETTDERHSAEERDVNEIGFDVVYRLARGTTLRFGYDYEDVDREEEELGQTETNTYKLALKSRINKEFSGNVSYTYQDIDEPMAGAHVGIAQGDGIQDLSGDSNLWYYNTSDFNVPADKTWYWTDVYPNRQLSSTSQPDEVHEGKMSGTWAPSTNLAATVFARVRYEENDDVQYEQRTFVPGASVYYAPNGKLNMTMAYTFNKQETENQMCVGWYHG
jgi:hypothetical protein